MSLFPTPELKDQPPRERILLTAHRLFYSDGIRATGIDRVIAVSGVAKATFYRCFPSKNELIQAFLAYRHEKWMDWFTDALRRHGTKFAGTDALVPVLREWFEDDGFRGCAFINSVVELGGTQPEVIDIARTHKESMAAAVATLLPPSRHRQKDAQAIALAIDGAIVLAQGAQRPEGALSSLAHILRALRAA
ncbi:TetR/AcrR family transcriptional regulator [Rhodoferax saidenbachensis]|uniref:AcrR family transcriptional regulator n=1 Tax=Rhodoferax saidenbachensis TaxID=1484693 RepID=A0ABU1ZQ96_9BURK|nr:TetR/AcrR family transcriptional regulator [Rhodoferax saidenbachensis]MDR7307716.1 AcrR family transcriptional regulator [Rhodoferax saidenbachensis]